MKFLFFQLSAVLFSAVSLSAAPDPYIGYLYPAGGQQGQKVRVIIGGQNLAALNGGVVSGSGVAIDKLQVIKAFPAPPATQRRYLIERLNAVEDGKKKPAVPENTDGWREHPWWDRIESLPPLERTLIARDLCVRKNALQASPSIRQMAIADITIAPDAAPGRRELRLTRSGRGNQAVTLPLPFYVDAATQVREAPYTMPKRPQPPPNRLKQIPATFNGQIMPGETDTVEIPLRRNQDYTFILTGRALRPFLGDAVPGHFQPILRLLTPEGEEAAFADDYLVHPDPVMVFRAPTDGVYRMEIRDNLYRGREDFVYRLQVLPGKVLPECALPAQTLLPEREAADAAAAAGFLPFPCAVRGTLLRPGETASFRFSGRKGETVVLAVQARRFGSPLDSHLTLIGPDGRTVAENDDVQEPLLVDEYTQHLDSAITCDLPQTGEYRILLTDTTGHGGEQYFYRLRIDRPRPDFQVYLIGSGLNLTRNAPRQVRFRIVRREGFAGPIHLVVPDRLLKLAGTPQIPADCREWTAKLLPGAAAATAPRAVELFAEAEIDGKTVRHPVIPADEFIQAFAHTHLLTAGDLFVAVRNSGNRKK